MDVIELARTLGHELQNDERYKRAASAAAAANGDETLGGMVADFEAMRHRAEILTMNNKEAESDESRELDEKMHSLYEAINNHPTMTEYTSSCAELEELVNFLCKIITGSANGEDPDKIEKQSACTGTCSTCGGCH